MAANGSINLVNLDFDTLKQSFKSHLSSQSAFKDYDLSGSNLNVLLELLSYNTYINSFYLNMVASEMFLDTAQLRSSVISHAKELNYVPRSFRSAAAVVDISITPTNPNAVTSVTIPRGTSFTSRTGTSTYTFTLGDSIVLTTSNNGVFTANSVTIYEGSLITDTFIYNATAVEQRFILSNPTVDTTSLRVYVTEDNGSSVLTYNQANSYGGISSSSQAFFVQAAESDLYEVVFGNGTQGRMPKHGSVISVVYRVGNGELPNGCSLFSSDDAIDGHTNVRVTTVSDASGGAVHETTRMIRKNAPRYYQTQDRAVTANDYKTLLQLAFPEIVATHVYGGEEANPPRYGKVIISVDIDNADGVSDGKKEEYRKYLKARCPLTIDPIFIDPEFLNVEVYTDVAYDLNTLTISEAELLSAIKTQVRLFNEQNLGDFNTTLRYSKLIQQIDTSGTSVIGNSTEVIAYKDLNPILNSSEPFTVAFNNRLKALNSAYIHPYVSNHCITSTYFTYQGQQCKIEDDGYGVIRIVSLALAGVEHVTVVNIGTVDYDTGEVVFSLGLNITDYEGSSIRLRAVTDSKDIVASQNNIIRIKDSDIYVTVSGESMSLLHDKISPLIESQFPAFYREEGPLFVNFVKEYYKWLESSGNALYHARHLLDYGDIDSTLDEFIPHFQSKYLAGSPVVNIVNQRDLIKHTRDIYQTKGTIDSLRLIFQMLFGETIEVYYPGDDILRPSDGDWVVPRYLELSLSPRTVSYVGKDVVGNISGATAFVERVDRRTYRGRTVDLLFITNIRANSATGQTFQHGEHITIDGIIADSPEVVGSLTRIEVTATGAGFGEGEIVDIVSSRGGREGRGRVTSVGNRTGEVNYVLVDGGYGYTNGTANVTPSVYVSANVLSITALNEVTPETIAFPEFSTIIQPLSNVVFNTSNTTFVVGDLVYGANATNIIATGFVLTSNTSASWLLISPHTTAKIGIDSVVDANTTGSFNVGEAIYQSNSTGNSAVGYVVTANTTYVLVDQRFGPFATNTPIVGSVSGCVANTANVITYAYDSTNFSDASITKIVRAETAQGALKSSATSLTATANVVGANSTAIGIMTSNTAFRGGAKAWLYSPATNATAEVTVTSSGLPGYFKIGGIDNTESVVVNTDTISPYLSTPISNGSAYGLPANTSAGYTSTIATALTRSAITIGSILSLTEKYPGFNNTAKPFVVEIERRIAAYGKPSNISCTLSNLVGGFRAGESITQTIPASKVTLTVADVSNTFNYAVRETIKQVRADSHVVYGELYLTNITGGAGTISVYVANTANTFDSVSPIVGLTSTATANVTNAATGTANLVASGVITDATTQLASVRRTSFQDFVVGRSIYGSETGSTANVIAIGWASNTNVLGNNAYVDPIAGIANGTIISLEVVDSGVFYESGEEVVLSADGNITPGAGIAYVESTGIKSGFWRGDRGTLDSSNRVQDNEYYQEYAYEIQSGVDRTLYESVVNDITHVAGTRMYSKFVKDTQAQSVLDSAPVTYDRVTTLLLPTSSSWTTISTLNVGDTITQVANSVVVASGRFIEARERSINSMVILANTSGTFTSSGELYIGAVSIGTIQGVTREIY